MSDLSIGFYKIIYDKILYDSILNDKGDLFDTNFAGDTMNSFNHIANMVPECGKSRKQRTPMEEWPSYVVDYFNRYHCLANFWILPSDVGRTLKGVLNKALYAKDYMDRFLMMVHDWYEGKYINKPYNNYFSKFISWEDFLEKHFLVNDVYVSAQGKVATYSCSDSPKKIIDIIIRKIENRAEEISKSNAAERLYKYFVDLKFIDN